MQIIFKKLVAFFQPEDVSQTRSVLSYRVAFKATEAAKTCLWIVISILCGLAMDFLFN